MGHSTREWGAVGVTESMETESRTRETMSIFERDKTFTQPIIWTSTLFMIGFHVAAIAALFFFTWKALAVSMLLWWVSGSLGKCSQILRLLFHP